jgi:hypothetical protein
MKNVLSIAAIAIIMALFTSCEKEKQCGHCECIPNVPSHNTVCGSDYQTLKDNCINTGCDWIEDDAN